MENLLWIVLGAVGLFVVGLILWWIATYNGLIGKRNRRVLVVAGGNRLLVCANPRWNVDSALHAHHQEVNAKLHTTHGR